MDDRRIFAGLKNSATKVFKLNQTRQMRALDPENRGLPASKHPVSQEDFRLLEKGMCAGLTTMWLKEKLRGTHPVFRRAFKDFAGKPRPGKIERILHGAAAIQLTHRKDYFALKDVMQDAGIASARWESAVPVDDRVMSDAHPRDIPSGFVRLCKDMAPGGGAFIRISNVFDKPPTAPRQTPEDPATSAIEEPRETHWAEAQLAIDMVSPLDIDTLPQAGFEPNFQVELNPEFNEEPRAVSSGHVVGLYKSRDNSLYFFDPNVGVYQVDDPASFIKTWVDVYDKKLDRVVMGGPEGNITDGFYTCSLIDRANTAGKTAT